MSATVNSISRCIGLYLLGISFALGSTSLRNIENRRKYNLFINTSAILLMGASVFMPFSTASFILDITNKWGANLMIADIALYQISALLMYEAMHVRGNAVIGDQSWFKYSVLFMRVVNISSVFAVSGLFAGSLMQGDTSLDVLSNPFFTFGVKLVECIAIGFGFILYGIIDYSTLSQLRGWANAVKVLDSRRQSSSANQTKITSRAIGVSFAYIMLTVALRVVLLFFKISSMTGYYFPIDYYLYHIDIGFTLYQMRQTEKVIARITGTSTHRNSSTDAEEITKKSNESAIPMKPYLGGNMNKPGIPGNSSFDSATTAQPFTPPSNYQRFPQQQSHTTVSFNVSERF